MKIVVVGAGYVGLSIATLLSQYHTVTLLEVSPERVEQINRREAPIHDPGIEEFFRTRQLDLKATGDPEQAYRLGKIACAEGQAVGCNYAFAPVVDIDLNYHNPITNVRTFGSDAQRVIACGSAYMRGARENGAVSISPQKQSAKTGRKIICFSWICA